MMLPCEFMNSWLCFSCTARIAIRVSFKPSTLSLSSRLGWGP